jgi:hypothetical protein
MNMNTNTNMIEISELELVELEGGNMCVALWGLGGALLGTLIAPGEGTVIGAEVGVALGKDNCGS